jgi:hypothetical protein
LTCAAGDSIAFDYWYSAIGDYKSVLNLQVIAEAMADFDAASTDSLRNRKVANFDFLGLANAFDNAGAPANWKLTDTLLIQHLSSTSDTAAIGADLAYRYGRNGSLTGLGFDAVQGILVSGSFGITAQALQSDAALMTGAKRLA